MNIHVGNLPLDVTEQELRTLFEPSGTIRLKTPRAASTCLCMIFAFCGIAALTGCTKSEQPKQRTAHLGGKSLAETIADNRAHLLSIPGVLKVEGADCGLDSCVKVTVEHTTAIVNAQIPMMLETYQVNVVEAVK